MRYLILLLVFTFCVGKKSKDSEKPDWAKKDIRDYSDADLERLLEQWDEDDDPLPPDELPDGHPKKPTPSLDLTKLDLSSPEELLKASKRGKTVMMFVRMNGVSTKEEADQLSSVWQVGLQNNHIQAERFAIEDDRVLYMFREGSQAWEAKDYVIEQEQCEEVMLEQQTYLGKHCKQCSKEDKEKEAKKEKEKAKKKKKANKKKTEL
eukprot:TRINITY_DN12691_c0_g2_i1.p1 TRINITY_DN12691_c0_g2~~TRINITY_DN12691_c0_g2_i1.p1  ORF type:complete len:207 (-),score=79.32 TRINITY_DN12691_c0_g2_i1:133-753(-)